ncbi:hypothetical protein A2448_03650 [Candidatus Peregrinibacteria bacterium RIFOXYC2_FULL_41_22]|nr:MAG: hypothetical protein A2448_03650 [Candidatus Peregrinibacteria bacterium RIFOXYC2_FULL_41_22]
MESLNQSPSEDIIRYLLARTEVDRVFRSGAGSLARAIPENRHLTVQAVDAIIGFAGKLAAKKIPRRKSLVDAGDIDMAELIKFFSIDFAYALVGMTFDPRFVMAGNTHNVKVMSRLIREYNPSLDEDAVIAMTRCACEIHRLAHNNDDADEHSLLCLDTARDMKRMSLGLTDDRGDDDPDWFPAFDDLVMKPRMVEILRGERPGIETYSDFWSSIDGYRSDMPPEDFEFWSSIDGEPLDIRPKPVERFLRIRSLVSRFSQEDRHRIYGDSRTHTDSDIIKDCFKLFYDIIWTYEDREFLEINTADCLLSLIQSTGLRELSSFSARLRSVVLA